MKKLLMLCIGLLLFAGCDNEDEEVQPEVCSICTVVSYNSIYGESSKTYYQSSEINCDMTQEQYKQDVDANASADDLLAVSHGMVIGEPVEVTHTITCVYE